MLISAREQEVRGVAAGVENYVFGAHHNVYGGIEGGPVEILAQDGAGSSFGI